MGQLDQVTQQNAALVEESAAAAECLKQQAFLLAQLVNKFQLAEQQTPSASLSAATSKMAPLTKAVGKAVPAAPQTKAQMPPPKTVSASLASVEDWETF